MKNKSSYIWVHTSILDDYEIANLPDNEWRARLEGEMNDPANIHYETQDYRRDWNLIRGKVAPVVFGRDGYKCVYCGSTKDLEVDHIYPLVKGGSNDLDNLQTLCKKCNRRKWAK